MTLEEIRIRYDWHPEEKRWHYSIVDLIDTVVVTSDARNYWKVLKNRLKKSGSPIVTSCNQLRLFSRDGKRYLTDTATKPVVLELAKQLSNEQLPILEHWINIIECSKPDSFIDTSKKEESSFPQKNLRNRLKNIFGF